MNSKHLQLIAYYRVSTARQGESGLGLEAQRAKVQQLAADRRADVVAEFTEVESGRKDDRPQLAAALAEARRTGAAIAVAKLDRLSRDAEFILRLSREASANGMGGFLFCDLDVDCTSSAGRLILGVMSSIAEFESKRISERTREAMAVAKLRGVKFGGPRPRTEAANAMARAAADRRAAPLLVPLRMMVTQGLSYKRMGENLSSMGMLSRAGTPLSAPQCRRLCIRLGLVADSRQGGKPVQEVQP